MKAEVSWLCGQDIKKAMVVCPDTTPMNTDRDANTVHVPMIEITAVTAEPKKPDQTAAGCTTDAAALAVFVVDSGKLAPTRHDPTTNPNLTCFAFLNQVP